LAHVQYGVPVSHVCENLGIHPNQYYEWQKQTFSSLPHVFSIDVIRQERSHQREFDNLKSKLSQKDEVIAELLTEHIALKKRLG
jgi:transposase